MSFHLWKKSMKWIFGENIELKTLRAVGIPDIERIIPMPPKRSKRSKSQIVIEINDYDTNLREKLIELTEKVADSDAYLNMV